MEVFRGTWFELNIALRGVTNLCSIFAANIYSFVHHQIHSLKSQHFVQTHGILCQFCFVGALPTSARLGEKIISGNLSNFLFPSNQCGQQWDAIDNDIEIDCLNPFPEFKVPKRIVYIHAIQCRDRTCLELPIDKWNKARVKRPISPWGA